MNHYLSGIIKIVLLEASVAVLLLDALAGARLAASRRWLYPGLAALMLLAWCNYLALRGQAQPGYVATALPLLLACGWLVGAGTGRLDSPLACRLRALTPRPQALSFSLAGLLAVGWVGAGVASDALTLVHPWEQYHFYLGAKYQREVGWFDLYKATLLADAEGAHALGGVREIRRIEDFEVRPVATELTADEAARVRARFSPEAWASFVADWAALARLWPINWGQVMADHGNSNSPAWSLVAHPLTWLVPVSKRGQSLLGWLDMLLMLLAFLACYATFGVRAASVAVVVFAAPGIVFDYLSGSLLRWDWLFALTLATVALARGRHTAAGALWGYAVATKLFPLFFGAALLARAAFQLARTRRVDRPTVAFFSAGLLSGAVVAAASAGLFGPGAWTEYARRIAVAQNEKFYAIQYSLKTVYLQWAESARTVDFLREGAFPAEVKQARPDVDASRHALGLTLARLAFAALVLVLLLRATEVESFTLGPLLVFAFLTVNMYYWNMLGLLALGLVLRAWRAAAEGEGGVAPEPLAALVGLHGVFGFFYFYQHFNRGGSEGFAVALLLVCWTVGYAGLEVAALLRPRSASPSSSQAAPVPPLAQPQPPGSGKATSSTPSR